jgi:hypothetical protein
MLLFVGYSNLGIVLQFESLLNGSENLFCLCEAGAKYQKNKLPTFSAANFINNFYAQPKKIPSAFHPFCTIAFNEKCVY